MLMDCRHLNLASLVTAPLLYILCGYTLPGKISFEGSIFKALKKRKKERN